MSQKLIILLWTVQTILLLALLVKVIGLESGIAEETIVPATANADVLDQPVIETQPISEEQLRRIVSEDVSSQLKSFGASLTQAESNDESEPVSAAEYQYRLEAAIQQLDYYMAAGQISESDMAGLQSEIAGLDDEGRRQMLGLLTQALNSGKLEGRF